jgi:lysozyme
MASTSKGRGMGALSRLSIRQRKAPDIAIPRIMSGVNRRRSLVSCGVLTISRPAESVSDQVANFLTYAKPEDDELISLDWEPSDGPDMTLEQAQHFVQMIRGETGRWPVVYGNHLLREQIGHNDDPILSNCPLWYVRYADSPIGIPTQVWASYTLWQYTDGDDGPEPHATPGATGADRNVFQGSTAELKAAWPFTHKKKASAHGAGFAHILGTPAKTSPSRHGFT